MLVEINLTQETAYKHNLQRMLRSVRMFCGFTENPPVYSRIVKHEVVEKPMPVEFIYALADYLDRR